MKLFSSKKNKSNQGFTLLEVLVAVAIFSISVLAMMSVLAQGIASTNYAKRKMVASYLAQEGVEYIRNQRDGYIIASQPNTQAGWESFKTYVANGFTYPIPPADTALVGFTRSVDVQFDVAKPNEVKISASVVWTHGASNKSVTFSEILFNWAE